MTGDGAAPARWPVAAATAGLLAAATTAATATAALLVRVVVAERRALADVAPALGPAAALVVFGGRFWPGPDGGVTPSGEMRARLDHARRLWEAGVAGVIVASGGVDDVTDEVDAMTDYLTGAGVPVGSLLPGRPGDNTRATMECLRRMADTEGLGPFVAVSSAYHARRIRDEARRAGLRVLVSSPADAPEARLPHVRRVRVGTEVVATAWYALPARWTARTPPALRRLRHSVPLRLARLRSPGPAQPGAAPELA